MSIRQACVLLTLPLLTVCRVVPAQHMNAIDAPCRDKVVTVEAYNCFDSAARVADKKLNQTYSAILARLSPDEQNSLRKAERMWVQFRDTTCRAERELYDGGTAAGPAFIACVEEETRLRIVDLLTTYGWRLAK